MSTPGRTPAGPQRAASTSGASSSQPLSAVESSLVTKVLKVNAPEEYHGDRNKLDDFLLQVELYVRFNSDRINSDSDKVLYAATYLRGRAAQWMKPFLKDWLNSAPDARNVGTTTMFESYAEFRSRITVMFGETNEKQRAILALDRLKQKGSAANYTADFQRTCFHTGYDDTAMWAAYYKGLKEEIKDELLHNEVTTDLVSLAKLAIEIDERMYHRRMEKKGGYPLNMGRQGSPKKTWGNKAKKPWDYGTTPMELDSAQAGPTRAHNGRTPGKKRFCKPIQGKRTTGSKGACYGCGQQGHFQRECPKGGSLGTSSKPPRYTPSKELAATRLTSHANHEALSWTACYDDSCQIHQGDKDGSGWYPKKPRAHSLCATRIIRIPTKKPTGERDKTTAEWGLADGDSEVDKQQQPVDQVEYTDSDWEEVSVRTQPVQVHTQQGVEEPDQGIYQQLSSQLEVVLRRIHFSMDGISDQTAKRVSTAVREHMGPVFKNVEHRCKEIESGDGVAIGKQAARIYEAISKASNTGEGTSEFRKWIQEAEENIRRSLNLRSKDGSIAYRDIVLEHPPVGSMFTTKGGYVTPDNGHISRELRMKLHRVRQEYDQRDPKKNLKVKVEKDDFQYIGNPGPFGSQQAKN